MCYSALIQRSLQVLQHDYGVAEIRTDLDQFAKASAANPKLYPPLHDRIFPKHYAPVIYADQGRRVAEVMRYGVYPPEFLQSQKIYDAVFNARRDNLGSEFWADACKHHHGFIVLKAFYEWVAVKDLLAAKVVSLDEVKAEFERQAQARRAKSEAAGKKHKSTPTELKDPRQRQIIIEFRPKLQPMGLIVPVLFTLGKREDGSDGKGFAIITDEPVPEVQAAGHDRTPILLPTESVDAWLHPGSAIAKRMAAVLDQKTRVEFVHSLPKTA